MSKKGASNRKNSFLDFERTTVDAWDASDEDLSELMTKKLAVKDGKGKSAVRQSQQQKTGEAAAASSQIKSGNFYRNNNYQKDSLTRSSSAPNTPSHLSGHRFVGGKAGQPSGKLSSIGNHVDARETMKQEKFRALLQAESSSSLDLEELRKISWSGVPPSFRPNVWKLLSGYLPAARDRRDTMLERKRTEYHNFVRQYFCTMHDDNTNEDTYQQIRIDVPRMSPLIPLFQQQIVRDIFERILFIWSIRHPASGYVQGINDLVTPFFVVFLAEYVPPDVAIETCEVSSISDENLQQLEADCFWCFSKLLDGIQDNYTFAQPGIQIRINALEGLVARIDSALHGHLRRNNVEYLQFSFRWMNNLLMREMPLNCVVRLWDTYMSEPDGFASFHLYVCAAFLTKFSSVLQKERDFHGLMLLLQNLPTHRWSEDDVGFILADAYRLKFMFADAPNHFMDNTAGPLVASASRTVK